MEVLLGMTGRDFTIVAASKAATRGPTILKATDDKTRALSDHTVMAYSGEAGDTVQFAEYIQANVALYAMRNGATLTPPAIAAFTRNQLATALRSRSPYTVNLLLGGVIPPTSNATATGPTPAPEGAAATDGKASSPSSEKAPSSESSFEVVEKPIPKLYWIDYLAACADVPYAAHGYAQYYCLSTFDKHHHPNITFEEGMKLLKMCSDELRRRLPIDYKGLTVQVCTAEGVRHVDFDDDPTVKAA